jgi:fatty acid desaturase
MSVAPILPPAAGSKQHQPTKLKAITNVEHKTIIDGVCYDLTNFMDTHPGQQTPHRKHDARATSVYCIPRIFLPLCVSHHSLSCLSLRNFASESSPLCAGGADLLMLAVDRDASILFHSYHRRLDHAKNLLKSLPIIPLNEVAYPSPVFGRKDLIHPDEKVLPTPYTSTDMAHLESPLYAELRAGVNAYFKSQGIDGRDMPSRGGMYTKTAILLALTCFTYYLVVLKGFWLLTPFLGIFFAMNGLAIQHDASHGAFSPNRYLNIAAGFCDDLIGGSGLMWRHQHVLAHHAYPNDMEWDSDTFNNYPFLRLNPALPKRWWHEFQHFYILFLYSLIGIDYSVNDITNYLRGHYAHITLHKLRMQDHILFIAGKLAHFTIVLFVPLAIYPWKQAIFTIYLPVELVGGFFLAALFAVSHNTDECEYNLPKTGPNAPCWAEMQIRTSANWSCHSTLWMWASGGLNYQIEHHLFPGVAHKHYPALHKIVKAVCEKKKIPYSAYPTFTEIFLAHLAKIKKLGQGEGLKKE